MNILMICTEKLPVPPVRGGAIQTYIEGVSSFLSKHHDVTILGTPDPSLPDDETVNNIRYVRTPGGLVETYMEGVTQFLQSHTFDVIHIFNRPRLVLPVRQYASDARLILSMHNDMFIPQKIKPEEAEAAINELDKIITISDYVGRTIAESFPNAASKLKTIYSGVDLDRFVPPNSKEAEKMREAIHQEYDLSYKKVILFAGRLSANKGADILVQAIGEVAKKHPDVALVLVGSKWFSVDDVSDYVAYVRALASRLPVPVINTGFVSPDEIQKWFAAADIFVCPSQWQEPLARVHYEAMASGLPIVTTQRGGNPEVIIPNENGLIVETPEDPLAFAKHLSTLLSNPQLGKKMGQYGRKLAEEKFTWNRVAKDILDVWNEIEEKMKNNVPFGAESKDEELILKEVEKTELQAMLEEELEQKEAISMEESQEENKKIKKREKLKSQLLNELSNDDFLLEVLLETVKQRMTENTNDEIQQIIQKLIAEQLSTQEPKKKETPPTRKIVYSTNDISTAKLFTNRNNKRRQKRKSN
ncbi:glycosyltransferase family 4 protein [Halalkalibacter nanhaiisediminis]|uniref:Spore coat protein SA n=1 Tax=Halalkalibacter nanhaiisediminis TaxID=688079 RepID=A0A562QD86_9BACI|nr:glycosyltransferase family 4 protein [Halalkalibacter nanhaiisediminis]TWI54669.1 spore coat protein SA [Halalkalibacter nanhaiisediminis]